MLHRIVPFFIASVLSPAFRTASASCGQATCPVESTARVERTLDAHHLTLDASWEYIDQDEPRVDTHRRSVGAVPAPEHDEIETVNRTYKVVAEYGITPRLSVATQVPIVQRDHRHLVRDNGEIEGWNFSGLGDVQLVGRYTLLSGETTPTLAVAAGAKLPTGRTDARNRARERAEVTLQPGTGSTDVVIGADLLERVLVPNVRGTRVTIPVFITTTARFTGTDGRDGYRAGTDWYVTVGSTYPVLERIDAIAQINFRFRDRDDAGRADGVPAQNTGGEYLYLSPGLRVRLLEGLHAYGIVPVPVYQRVNGIQLTSAWGVALGVSYQMSLTASD